MKYFYLGLFTGSLLAGMYIRCIDDSCYRNHSYSKAIKSKKGRLGYVRNRKSVYGTTR